MRTGGHVLARQARTTPHNRVLCITSRLTKALPARIQMEPLLFSRIEKTASLLPGASIMCCLLGWDGTAPPRQRGWCGAGPKETTWVAKLRVVALIGSTGRLAV